MIKFSIIMPVRKINDFVKESISRIKKIDYRDFVAITYRFIVYAFSSKEEKNKGSWSGTGQERMNR